MNWGKTPNVGEACFCPAPQPLEDGRCWYCGGILYPLFSRPEHDRVEPAEKRSLLGQLNKIMNGGDYERPNP